MLGAFLPTAAVFTGAGEEHLNWQNTKRKNRAAPV